ncbi:MAG TPA: hypothetical protein VLJ68_13105 [Chitinophagaceae bacterium]|nr:hypothetical protein [Chitinophagaceae bacterium]
MKFLFALIACIVLMTACVKNKFTTEPQIHIKSITPNTVFSGDVITVKSKYTDKEGDIDSVYVVYKWYNGNTVVRADTFRYVFDGLGVPPQITEADLDVTFEYNTGNIPHMQSLPGVFARDTTASFGLILIDKGAHRSSYSESDKIRLKKP